MSPDGTNSSLFTPLKTLETPRVWSMLVTIFGDLAQESTDRIDGRVLSQLTDGLDIKPEAMRVALHRLRQDNWITSKKRGRTATHALSELGLKQSQAASNLIYSAPSQMDQSWQLIVTERTEQSAKTTLASAGFVQIAPRVFVASATAVPPPDCIALTDAAVPAWLQDQCVTKELTAEYDLLLTRLIETNHQVMNNPPHTPVEIAILRCLIVHHWRRLVLRHPYLPPALTKADWPGHACRAQVTSLLNALPRPTIEKLHGQ